jgi:hypothetical protein
MKFILIALFCLISFSTEETSGIKADITSNIFKLLTKFDLNNLVQNMTVTDRAETLENIYLIMMSFVKIFG